MGVVKGLVDPFEDFSDLEQRGIMLGEILSQVYGLRLEDIYREFFGI